jgi:hypothetical protein
MEETVLINIFRYLYQLNLTLIIALLGLSLSICLAINEINKGKPKIRLSLRQGYFIDENKKNSEPMIDIEAVNVGSGPLIIASVGWLRKDGSSYSITKPIDVELPHELEERHRISIQYACRGFRDDPARDKIISAFVRDETGKTWKTRIKNNSRRAWETTPLEGWIIGRNTTDNSLERKEGMDMPSTRFPRASFVSSKNPSIIKRRTIEEPH